MKKIHVLHGPNLNLLGLREPFLYGDITLANLNADLKVAAEAAGFSLSSFQSNSESQIIDAIHQAFNDSTNFIIINPAAFTHTSVAIRDALLAVKIPFIEVHISNIYAREDFRKHSYLSDIAAGIISGFGTCGYNLAIQ